MNILGDEWLVPLANQQIGVVVALSFRAIDHVPMVADEHPLLEQGGVRAGVAKLPSQAVTHVIHLNESRAH